MNLLSSLDILTTEMLWLPISIFLKLRGTVTTINKQELRHFPLLSVEWLFWKKMSLRKILIKKYSTYKIKMAKTRMKRMRSSYKCWWTVTPISPKSTGRCMAQTRSNPCKKKMILRNCILNSTRCSIKTLWKIGWRHSTRTLMTLNGKVMLNSPLISPTTMINLFIKDTN